MGIDNTYTYLRQAILASLVAILASCTLGPNFKSPQISAPDHWQASDQVVEKPLDTQWWHILHDPVLDKLVTRIAAENLDVQTATERVEESRAERSVSASGLFPQLTGTASYTREKISDKGIVGLIEGGGASASSQPNGPPSTSTTPPFNIYQYGFDASWEIDLWGKIRRGVESADAQLTASEEARRDADLSAIAELVSDYIQLRSTQASLAITQDSLNATSEIARLVQERFAVGLSNALDVANAKARTATVKAQLAPLKQQQARLRNAIALLLGQLPGTLEKELSEARPIPPAPPMVPIGVPSELVKRRPDIRKADAQLHAATAQIGIAKADFFPDVSLTGNGLLQSISLTDLNTWAARSYMYGPAVTLPIFQGGRLVSTLALRNAQQREAATVYRKTVLNAFHEVDNALTAFRNEQERGQALGSAVEQDNLTLKLATSRYREGLSDFIDVLTAERSLLDARLQVVNSQQMTAINMVQLYKALGGGWQVDFASH